MIMFGEKDHAKNPDCYPEEAREFLVKGEILRQAIPEPDPNSRKNQNGRIMIVVGGSPLFHGGGRMSAQAGDETFRGLATIEANAAFAGRTNDMVYFCSTPENVSYLKERPATFIGIQRGQLKAYLPHSDVVLIGPGLMRTPEVNFPETEKEPLVTKELTELVLASGKKAVLDAGSIQVIAPEALKGKKQVIITPHRGELKMLFGVEPDLFLTSHQSTFAEIKEVAERLKKFAEDYQITILLKGPVDIIVNWEGWFFSPGGNAGMTKGGTGDVLAGVVAAIYSRIDNPLLAAAAGSYLCKRAGEDLWQKQEWFFNATDLAHQISETLIKTLVAELRKSS